MFLLLAAHDAETGRRRIERLDESASRLGCLSASACGLSLNNENTQKFEKIMMIEWHRPQSFSKEKLSGTLCVGSATCDASHYSKKRAGVVAFLRSAGHDSFPHKCPSVIIHVKTYNWVVFSDPETTTT